MKRAHRSVVGTALCKGWVPDPDPAGPTLEETSLAALLRSAPRRVVCPHVAPGECSLQFWAKVVGVFPCGLQESNFLEPGPAVLVGRIANASSSSSVSHVLCHHIVTVGFCLLAPPDCDAFHYFWC